MQEIFNEIKVIIEENPVVVFMKGTSSQPMCGFSSNVIQILNILGVQLHYVDVLKDDRIRAAIKEFSKWPTIPQLYVNGVFIGGCDIVKDMYSSGELQSLLKKAELL